MTFEWALARLREGKRVYRLDWDVTWSCLRDYIQYDPNYADGKRIWASVFSKVQLKPPDLEADDWELWEPKDPIQKRD